MRLTLSIALSFVLAASSGQAAVTGYVLDAEGRPIAGATVAAIERESDEQAGRRRLARLPRPALATVTTASDGAFRFDLKEPFAWVQASAAGFVPVLQDADELVPVHLTLEPRATRRGTVTASGGPVRQ